MHVRQTIVSARVAVRQSCVVDAQEVQDRRGDVAFIRDPSRDYGPSFEAPVQQQQEAADVFLV